jgi:endonuclease G, mitochondrial
LANARTGRKAARKRRRGILSEEELIQLVRRKAQRYIRLPNVTSVGVGDRIRDGEKTDELTIQFTVRKKLSSEVLAMQSVAPLPKFIVADDGTEVPVDVVERSYRPSYQILQDPAFPGLASAQALTNNQMRRTRLATIVPGISVGHSEAETGTFGAVVYDALNGTPYILSNWHVLQGVSGKLGDVVTQPGLHDDGNGSANVVGQVVRSHIGLAGDCAVATISGRGLDPRILELNVVPKRIGLAKKGDKVVKSGRTSGVTFGIVSRVGVVFSMDYGDGEVQVGGFEIAPNPAKLPAEGEVSDIGDSGSVWLVDTNGPDKDVVLGLLFAGETDPNPAEEHAIACNIHSVMQKLQISFKRPSP